MESPTRDGVTFQGWNHLPGTESPFRGGVTYRGRSLLEDVQQMNDLCLLFHTLDVLDDIEAGRPSTPHVHCDRLHEGAPGEVLDLLWHRRREQQSLALGLGTDGSVSWGQTAQ